MQRIAEYLKERNIPKDSLEANSILEGYELGAERTKRKMIEKAAKFIYDTIFNWADGSYHQTFSECRMDYINKFRQAMEDESK